MHKNSFERYFVYFIIGFVFLKCTFSACVTLSLSLCVLAFRLVCTLVRCHSVITVHFLFSSVAQPQQYEHSFNLVIQKTMSNISYKLRYVDLCSLWRMKEISNNNKNEKNRSQKAKNLTRYNEHLKLLLCISMERNTDCFCKQIDCWAHKQSDA